MTKKMASRKPSWRTTIIHALFLCTVVFYVRLSISHSRLASSIELTSRMEDNMIYQQTKKKEDLFDVIFPKSSYRHLLQSNQFAASDDSENFGSSIANNDDDDGVGSESASDDDASPNHPQHWDAKTLADAIISEYQSIVSSHLHHQAASWFRYLGSYRVEEDEVDVESTLRNFHRRRKRRVFQEETNRTFIWDKEEDIPRYFHQLTEACAKVDSTTEIYAKRCLLFLYDLIHRPVQ
jgi:hypothetical protein